ncbi:MAG: diguanylate cyclase [Candidatus Omnitrophica bacterium]|nr:diguanylate cyclase [Candidatus Omnitrophota bacterium]
MDKTTKILFVIDDKELKTVLEFCFKGWGYEVFFETGPAPDIAGIMKISPDVVVVDVHSATKSRLEICDVLKDDFVTAYIPIIILINKRQLRQHLLNLRQGVDDYLIKPPDPLDLRIRIEMAIKRSQHSFYASPLTGLPGGILIEEVLKEKIDSGACFAAGHVDIDNFKSFNDKYGYLKGDRGIMQTAYMLSTAVRNWGNKNDFLGHIGGDDFMFVTTPDKYKDICQNFICMFDTIIPFHYSPDARENGFIIARDRNNRSRKLSLMSVTIALVIKNNPAEFTSILELDERIAEVKQYLKKIPGSKYMADRRMMKKDESLTLQVFTNDESLKSCYRPLGQVLLEKRIISGEQLDKALKKHWKRGILLGEVLTELGFLTDEQLSEALDYQENGLKAGV